MDITRGDGVFPLAVSRRGDTADGDHVQFRSWLELCLKKHDGRVLFVSGVSPHNGSLEYNGLKWVAVRYAGETETAPVVHPETGVVRGLTFVGRTDDSLISSPRMNLLHQIEVPHLPSI